MEKKQLNLSAPLLSARRYSSPQRTCGEESRKESFHEQRNPIPAKKGDVNLGEVVRPGSVPFTWEQIPGRAKSQVKSPEGPPSLPPGRLSGVKSGELRFLRPQNKLPSKFLSGELPRLRAQNRLPSFPVYEAVKSPQVNHRATDSGSDSFSDALDALEESCTMNCSTSGLSAASDLPISKPCANASSTNRDFMMNRFLPAAKAMTLESPQYASNRQIVPVAPPQLSKVIVPKIVKPAPEKTMSITLYTGQDIGDPQSEDEEEEGGGFVEPRNISVKSCGFFPWFCSRNALRLLNPVPAMKIKTKSALASASKVGKLVKNASYKSPSRTNSKVSSTNNKHKKDNMTKSCELKHIEVKPKARPMFYSGELPTRNGNSQARNALSPYRNYKRSSVSPCRNESAHSPFHSGVLIVPKRVDQTDEYSRHKTNDRASNMSSKFRGSCPGSPVTEKTLHVDSVNITRARPFSSGRMEIIKARGVTKPAPSIECQTDDILSKMTQSSRVAANGRHVNSSRELVPDPATQSPLPPPLPKSPSESWLSRNLNAVSPRNSVSQSHGGNKFQPRQPAGHNASTKWETIVKTSHLRCDHGRFSEELVARVPQQSRRRK